MVIDAVLDTSVIIDFLRAYPPAQTWIASQQSQRFGITPIVWMETVQGATNKDERARAIRFLRQFGIEHATENDNQWAMLQLARFGLSHGVQFPDVMIASVTVRLGVTLYTLNMKHYAPLPDIDARRPY